MPIFTLSIESSYNIIYVKWKKVQPREAARQTPKSSTKPYTKVQKSHVQLDFHEIIFLWVIPYHYSHLFADFGNS